MASGAEKLQHELRAKMRDFWRGIINDIEDPEKFMPDGLSDTQKAYAYSYYIVLMQTAGEALKAMLAEAAESEISDARAKASAQPKRYFDANPNSSNKTPEQRIEEADARLRELDESVRAGKLIYVDELLKNSDAVFESFRNDLIALPFELLKSSRLESNEEFKKVCESELDVMLNRFQNEIGQAIASAIRQSQGRAAKS